MTNELTTKARTYAVHIEEIMCSVFDCKRFGFGGIVNSDYIRKHPFQAMCCALAKNYNGNEENIDVFLELYRPFADCSLDMLLSFEPKSEIKYGMPEHVAKSGEEVVQNMIENFRTLCQE